MSNKLRMIGAVASVCLIFDQITKFLVVRLIPRGASFHVCRFFAISHVRNSGILWGLFREYPGTNVFMVGISVVIFALLAVYALRVRVLSVTGAVALGMLEGGILGNLVDRVRVSRVIDFLDFRVWPVFNVADACIVTGVALTVFCTLRGQRTGDGKKTGVTGADIARME